METERIAEILQKIKSNYQRIYQLTETANLDADTGKCLRLIEKRNRLLADISADQALLEKGEKNWQEACTSHSSLNRILSEISTFIAMTAALDTILQQRLSQRIDSLKNDLRNLNNSSKMALSYARNTVNSNIR